MFTFVFRHDVMKFIGSDLKLRETESKAKKAEQNIWMCFWLNTSNWIFSCGSTFHTSYLVMHDGWSRLVRSNCVQMSTFTLNLFDLCDMKVKRYYTALNHLWFGRMFTLNLTMWVVKLRTMSLIAIYIGFNYIQHCHMGKDERIHCQNCHPNVMRKLLRWHDFRMQ